MLIARVKPQNAEPFCQFSKHDIHNKMLCYRFRHLCLTFRRDRGRADFQRLFAGQGEASELWNLRSMTAQVDVPEVSGKAAAEDGVLRGGYSRDFFNR